jgi:GntR family transcriptional regulator
MALNFDTVQLKKHVSYEEQVQEMIREKVLSGEFAPGEKILSARKIAAELGTNSFTVLRALGVLRKEGLLISHVGKGTFVQKREEKLTCIGVYCQTGRNTPFTHAVAEALRDELEEAGIEIDLWMDPRPRVRRREPWKPLLKAAEAQRFQALIVTDMDIFTERWQSKLPVPTAFMTAGSSIQNSVDHDMRQFVKTGLQELARQGCRSVGFISPVLTAPDPDSPECLVSSFDMLGHFTDIAGELGLTMKNDWMRVVRDPSCAELEIRAQERFGYDQFLQLWSQPEKPDGLLVFSDVIARGVIMAVQKEHVRVPEDLKLALHKNESIDLFCPMPATFIVASEREVARALITQVQKQFCGESCERILLPFKLAAHDNLNQ